jgi:circadian clock protein KaiC
MVVGNSGSGKTILCSHFLYHGLTAQEENGLYISFSESKAQFYANLKTIGMDFDKFERQAKFAFLDFASLCDIVITNAARHSSAVVVPQK